MNTMRQCKVSKATIEGGAFMQVVWLPTKFAVPNTYVKVKVAGEWDDHWHVDEVFGPEVPETEVAERSRDFTKTRKASDV